MEYPKAGTAALKRARALSRKGPRTETDLFIVEGPKLIADAAEAGWSIGHLFVTRHTDTLGEIHGLVAGLQRSGTEVMQCTEKEMSSISPTQQPQGVLAIVRQQHATLGDLPGASAQLLLALDGVQDPGNTGTCIRSADWFGASGVLLGVGCASIYNDKTVRATAGSLFHIPCVETPDLPGVLKGLREQGCQILGADQASPVPFTDVSDARRRVLVLGSEASGFSPAIRSLLDMTVSIPRLGNGESLNVSIAGSVILSHLARLHGTSG